MRITLKAKSGSGEEPYDVDFLFKNGTLSVSCNCRAGIFHMLCKHRLAFLKGEPKMLINPAQSTDLAQVVQWAEQAGLSVLLQQLDEAEGEVALAQKKVKMMRKRIEENMSASLGSES